MALQVERTRELATPGRPSVSPAASSGGSRSWRPASWRDRRILSLPTGFCSPPSLVKVLNVRSFGWTMRLQTDPMVFVQALG